MPLPASSPVSNVPTAPYVPMSGDGRAAALRPSAVETVAREDGTLLLQWPRNVFSLEHGEARADAPVNRQVPNVVDWLGIWAAERPNTLFMAERDRSGQWQRLNYMEAWHHVQRIACALMRRLPASEVSPTLAILTGNSVRQALLTFAALYAGMTVAPISPGYATGSESARLRAVLGVLSAQLVYCEAIDPLESTLQALGIPIDSLICAADLDDWRGGDAPIDTEALARAHACARGDRVGKIMFTSGSTGVPKGVVMSHEMLASAQATTAANLVSMPSEPPTYLEWLPWHHVMGGNVNLHRLLRLGGSAWLDGGKPVPGKFQATIDNLREVAPSFYFNVPLGYAMLVPALESDDGLARQFFSRLDYLSYGGAQIGVDLAERIDKLAIRHTGGRVPVTSAYGATETTGPGLSTGPGMPSAGALGLPAPGVVAKLVSAGDRYELRLAGGNVRGMYLGLPDASAAAVDEEGYYRTGDAVRWVDPANHMRGLAFAGRIAEDFKLASGTWVNVGALRVRLVESMAPLVTDAAITGHDRNFAGALLFMDEAQCRSACPGAAHLSREALVRHPALVEEIARRLAIANTGQAGSSHRIERALLLPDPPSAEGFEITDKGYLNQRAVLERHAGATERLHHASPDAGVATCNVNLNGV